MKFIPNPFRSDTVEFTWLDLLKLACGRELKCGALIARRAAEKELMGAGFLFVRLTYRNCPNITGQQSRSGGIG